MATLAMLYGLISQGSIWYPVNLLGAVLYTERQVSTGNFAVFHIELLVVAFVLHLTFSALTGILYAALLPMLHRHPILLGGLFAPLVWTGLLRTILGNVNPVLNQNIACLW